MTLQAIQAGVAVITRTIADARFPYPDEATLQAALDGMLTSAGVGFRREFRLGGTSRDRIDFLLDDGIGIEVKVDGSAPNLARQVLRYVQHEEVQGLIVVTTRAKHQTIPNEAFGGKPGRVVFLLRSAL